MNQHKTITMWVISQIFSIVIISFIWYFTPMIEYTYTAIVVFVLAGIYDLFKIIKTQKNIDDVEINNGIEEKRDIPDIEWNIKNISLLSGALLFMVGAILYGVNTADEQLAQKRKKIMAMPISEVADYIIAHNDNRRIDPITKIDKIIYKEYTMTFYYQVEGGMLEKAASYIQNIDSFKARVTREFKAEDCSKTAFSVFLDKNGTMHYVYHKVTDNNKAFMFDVNITKEICDN